MSNKSVPISPLQVLLIFLPEALIQAGFLWPDLTGLLIYYVNFGVTSNFSAEPEAQIQSGQKV